MYTSDKYYLRVAALKTAVIYLAAAAFLAVFAIVYESFGHGVYSLFMVFAFLFPLLLGAVPFCVIGFAFPGALVSRAASSLYGFGVAALATGSVVKGVLDIYGTENSLLIAYWIAGGALCAAGIIVWIVKLRRVYRNQLRA